MEHRRPPKRGRPSSFGPRIAESDDLPRIACTTTNAAIMHHKIHNKHDSAGPPSQQAKASHAQLAKLSAIEEAWKDGCTGSFKSFDSEFGNFLVPVIPTLDVLRK
ncbi:uncharacterized protein LOC116249287 isoform X2 [Nymphaea colorata]|uniref:uncharacterized protein LOC116249287 isoform X2 n=1 Tax=Nymphaea colorata TaxID=210225 RepID=UPI00129E8A71|nr:uncharacterized protein LOC116249287 isoform X2 [Nymphaea colorata]